jgi:hypothetical protein
MKAVRFHDDGNAEVLCYEDAPTPKPGPREILAAAFNPADGRYARACGAHLRNPSRATSAGNPRLWTMGRQPPCGRDAEALEYVSQNIPGRPPLM